jgi:hypothetical protein
MATWKLSNLEKKSCIEREHWTHPDYDEPITRETGFRWGTFYCESDEKPDIDLANPNGYSVYDSDYDWELDSMDDGCWEDWTWPDSIPEEERERLEALWEEDSYSAWEEAGLYNSDTDVELIGELSLEEA